MIRMIDEIYGYGLLASDGEIGQCDDFLFDDRDWTIRYMVAKTRKWLPGRKVLISPVHIGQPNWAERRLPVCLTREQVRHSPSLEEDAPISHQYELAYHQYYEMPLYWAGHALWGPVPTPDGVVFPQADPAPIELDLAPPEPPKHGMRSINEVEGYQISTKNGEMGHIDDFLIDDQTYQIHFLVIATRSWLPGRKILLAPDWLDRIDWVTRRVEVDLATEILEQSPDFDPSMPLNRQYEERLYDYYGRPYPPGRA